MLGHQSTGYRGGQNNEREFTTLAQASTAPAMRYDFAYVLPSDWVRTISLHDNDAGVGHVSFEEGQQEDVGVLFASISTAFLAYVSLVTDPNLMPPDFQTAFVYALAVQMPGISNIGVTSWEPNPC